MSTPLANTKIKSKPSYYPAFPFHAIRTISAFSSIVVSAILIFFCISLKNDDYKIPWTFLIVLAASIITLLWLLLTLFIHCCGRLSPIFNMLLNIPLLIVWVAGLGLLTWGIYGTLSHSCTKINWGNDDGIMICQQYKALFSFVIFGSISQVALIVLDVRARIAQTRSGKYVKMNDVKLEPFDSTHHSLNNSAHDLPYQDQINNTARQDEPGWRPGQRTNSYESHTQMNLDRSGTTTSSRYSDYGDIAGREGQAQFRMGQFDSHYSPQQQTGYNQGWGQGYSNPGNPYGSRY